jgi:hypothetical protein
MPPIPDAMVGSQRKRRIAVGVFDTLPALERAVDGLVAAGIKPSGMTIVAGRAASPGSLAEVMPQDELSQRGIVILTGTQTAAVPFETWGIGGVAGRLRAHLADGACALVASVDTPEVEGQVLKVLLALSIDQVQQHDVMTAASA